MDLTAELARFNPDPALAEWVSGTLGGLLEQTRKDAVEIRLKDLKIQALTLELARHKRILFSHKSEAFTPEQRDLFQEASAKEGPTIPLPRHSLIQWPIEANYNYNYTHQQCNFSRHRQSWSTV